jgi:hypothetical protein
MRACSATDRRSVPFDVAILMVMAAIVVSLSLGLSWLGRRSVRSLEKRAVDEQMMELDDTTGGFLTGGLRTVVLTGLTLADRPTFAAQAGPAADKERLRQRVAVLCRHPVLKAAYIGYDDGLFLCAGRTAEAEPAAERPGRTAAAI